VRMLRAITDLNSERAGNRGSVRGRPARTHCGTLTGRASGGSSNRRRGGRGGNPKWRRWDWWPLLSNRIGDRTNRGTTQTHSRAYDVAPRHSPVSVLRGTWSRHCSYRTIPSRPNSPHWLLPCPPGTRTPTALLSAACTHIPPATQKGVKPHFSHCRPFPKIEA